MAEKSETLSQLLNESQEMEDENMFGSAGDSQWRTVSYAKRKREGSNVEFETYQGMGTDDKLNVLFEKLEAVGQVQTQIGEIQTEVKNVSIAVNEHDDKLKYLTYKVLDLETKSRNKNILIGSRYAVDRDYPTEIRLARKSMWSEYKEYRRNRNNKVQLRFPAALYVNHRLMRDAFPHWNDLLYPKAESYRKPDSVSQTSRLATGEPSTPAVAYTQQPQRNPPWSSAGTTPHRQPPGVSAQPIVINTAVSASQGTISSSQSPQALTQIPVTNLRSSQIKTQGNVFVQPSSRVDSPNARGRPRSRASSSTNKGRGRSTSLRAPKVTPAGKKTPSNQNTETQNKAPPPNAQQSTATGEQRGGGD